jgi:hypothetical protein
MLGKELKRRLDRLALPRKEAAGRLGLSEQGLYHQMRGDRPVTRQTELLLEGLEERLQQQQPAPARRKRSAA